MAAPVLLDLSHTSHTRARTGIQRVARSIRAALGDAAAPVTFDPYAATWRGLAGWERANLEATAAAPKRGARWPFGAKLAGRARRVLGVRPTPAIPATSAGLIVPEIFSAAVGAALPALFAHVRGPRVAVFHDAIALKLPELTPAKTVARFPAYLRELLMFDGIAAISDDSREVLLEYWRWLGVARMPQVQTIPLGVDVDRIGLGVPVAPANADAANRRGSGIEVGRGVPAEPTNAGAANRQGSGVEGGRGIPAEPTNADAANQRSSGVEVGRGVPAEPNSERLTGDGSPYLPPPAVPVVLSIGSIEGRKNHLALLEACETLWARGLRFELHLVGLAHPETGRPALERLASLQSARRPIRYAGPAEDAAVEQAYHECTFTVYPSLMEGFGLPVLESLAHGKPCICSGRGALGEATRAGGCIALDRVDAPALANAMDKLLSNPAELDRLAAEARCRTFRTWSDYGRELTAWMASITIGKALEPRG